MAGLIIFIDRKTTTKIPILTRKGLYYSEPNDINSETILQWKDIERFTRLTCSENSILGKHLRFSDDLGQLSLTIKLQHCTDAFRNFGYHNSWDFNRRLLMQVGYFASEKLRVDPAVFVELAIDPETWEFNPKPRRMAALGMYLVIVIQVLIAYFTLHWIGPHNFPYWITGTAALICLSLVGALKAADACTHQSDRRDIRLIQQPEIGAK